MRIVQVNQNSTIYFTNIIYCESRTSKNHVDCFLVDKYCSIVHRSTENIKIVFVIY